jgi:hypothetical protein
MNPVDPTIGRRMRPTLMMRFLLWLSGRPARRDRPQSIRLPRDERLANHLRRDIGLPPLHDWEPWG